MTKIYIGELLPDTRIFPILNRHIGKKKYTGKKAYRAVFDEMDFSFLELVHKPEEAHFLLIPYNYFTIKDNIEYINHFVVQAEKYNKHIVVFAFGDSEEEISIPHAIVFRYAGYRYLGKKKNEIIMPTQIYASDILKEELFFLRDKRDLPVVSFCGWAGFSSFREYLGYLKRMIPFDARRYLLFEKYAHLHKQGIYFRKKAIKALQNSPLIETSFIVRNFYSANKYTLQGDPKELRKEYIENIQNSDFVLVARGDSNMAVRFYETLALGRIPVLIDTEWLLPLEDKINYRDFVIFVPHDDIKNTDKYIRKFWDKLSNDDFHAIQRQARETFMKYLKFDSFLRYTFEQIIK